MSNILIEQLRNVVGSTQVLTDGDLSAYEADWRRRYFGKALAIVRPESTEQVVEIVRLCALTNVSIVTQGGNTGLVGGSIPNESGTQIVLNMGRMSAIRSIDADNLTITVEAGCVLQILQEKVREAGFLFPLSLGAEGSCTIGGNLATNAGGTQVLRYGNARELCLGLEVVMPSGKIWNGLAGLRKDNTGYDLRNLFIGSEGTLGIITAATLKVYPLPAAVLTGWATVPSIEHAVNLLGLARKRLGPGLSGFELMGRFGLELVAQHTPQVRAPLMDQPAPYHVLIEHSDSESQEHAIAMFEGLFEEALEQELVQDAVFAQNVAQARQMWQVREHMTMAQMIEGPNVKHDIAVPTSKIPSFVTEVEQALHNAIPGVRPVNFGHLGDGNLHFNVYGPLGIDKGEFLVQHEQEVVDIVLQMVAKFGGSFSAEHGVGATKVNELQRYECSTALHMMQAIKSALDPNNLMNPGRVLASS